MALSSERSRASICLLTGLRHQWPHQPASALWHDATARTKALTPSFRLHLHAIQDCVVSKLGEVRDLEPSALSTSRRPCFTLLAIP